MRGALLLAAALIPLLTNAAGAQNTTDPNQKPPESVRANVKIVKPKPAHKSEKGKSVKRDTVMPDRAPAMSSAMPEPDLYRSISSMDLAGGSFANGTFAIPLVSAPVEKPAAQADTPQVARSSPVAGAVHIDAMAGAEPAILLRADADVGLAAFRIGSETIIVLDAPIAFGTPGPEIAAAFAGLTSRVTDDTTVLRMPGAAAILRFARTPRGWLVAVGAPPDTAASILPRSIDGGQETTGVRLPAAEPSRVVTVLNPQTGDRLLVGTQGVAGQSVPNAWHQPQFDLLPTLQGVVVAAISDDIRLRREPAGFSLSTSLRAESAIADAPKKTTDRPIAGAISRLLDIPNGSTKELSAEMNKRVAAAGEAHALARSEPRLRVAEAMLALGMDVEAQSVVDVAIAADPALADQPHAIGLRAIAATLAGRFDDAKALADPRLDGSTEVELWRALLRVARDEASAPDARSLADGVALILAYPSALRDRLLPRALETMALNGQAETARATLKAFPNAPALDLARGMALEMENNAAGGLKLYDQVAMQSDRLARYTALVRAAELRIKSGQLDAKAGADALDQALLGWRGPKQEFALRMRIADLRRQAGQWHEALTVLRDGRDVFPEERANLDRTMEATFLDLLTSDAAKHLSPAEFVSLYDQNQDLVQDINWTEKNGTSLVDRLIGLGLQGRAEPITARLVAQSNDLARRPVLGARLASLRLTMNDPKGAIAALASTVPAADVTVDPAVMQTRQLLYARGEIARGNRDAALTMLGTLDLADADELRAQIYASRKDWPHTVSALTALEHKAISAKDITDAQQSIVMRLAVAATLSSDSATLGRLADTYGAAMAKGNQASLFRVITSSPVQGTADLPRAFEEIQVAKRLEGAVGTP